MLKRKSRLFIVIIIIMQMFFLTGCSRKDDGKELKNKVDEEMKYLDSQIIGMINNLNNISYKNYLVLQQNKDEDKEKNSSNKTNTSTQESNGSSQSSSEGQSSNNNEGENKITSNTFDVIPNSILDSNREPNWDVLKSDIENLYRTWSTVMLDLYKLKIDNNDILQFTTILDSVTKETTNKDKQKTVNLLANLYEYIPRYMSNYTENEDIQIMFDVKVNVLNSYALLEEEKWDNVKSELKIAEEKFMKLLKKAENSDKNLNTDKIYVALKELQQSIEARDKNIYYMKYRNLLEEMNTM